MTIDHVDPESSEFVIGESRMKKTKRVKKSKARGTPPDTLATSPATMHKIALAKRRMDAAEQAVTAAETTLKQAQQMYEGALRTYG